jgi:arginine/lysine/ornithine decarboxylase
MLTKEDRAQESNKIGLDSDTIVQGYIIPYPPGVPLAVPGDVFTRNLHDEIARLQRAGVDVFFINQ